MCADQNVFEIIALLLFAGASQSIFDIGKWKKGQQDADLVANLSETLSI